MHTRSGSLLVFVFNLFLLAILVNIVVSTASSAQATATQTVSLEIPEIKILRTEGSVAFGVKDLQAKEFDANGIATVTKEDATNLTRINNVQGLKVTVEWQGAAPRGFGSKGNVHKLEVRAGSNNYMPITNTANDLIGSIGSLGTHTYSLDYRLTANATAGNLPKTSSQILFTMTSKN